MAATLHTGKELLDAGHLAAAIKQVTEEVKANPGDAQRRTFLFELLCFSGDLDRARKQLDAVGQETADSQIAVQSYINLLNAEQKRRRLFSAGLRPKMPEAAPYAETQLAAVDRFREGDVPGARELLEQAEAERPALTGSADGKEFEDFKDADDLIGPFLEIMIQDDYCWIPWEAVKSVSLTEPKHLRDLAWLPCSIELRSGSAGGAHLPVLYAGSYTQDDDAIRLGRITKWRDDVPDFSVGLGQKLFAAGDRDLAILEIRLLEFRENANAHSHS
ncbi:MAG: type VI secretion system accessory protein TagJ [Bryobacteraceae bacterium]